VVNPDPEARYSGAVTMPSDYPSPRPDFPLLKLTDIQDASVYSFFNEMHIPTLTYTPTCRN